MRISIILKVNFASPVLEGLQQRSFSLLFENSWCKDSAGKRFVGCEIFMFGEET